MKNKYNLEKLKEIDIVDVLIALGGNESSRENAKAIHCPNVTAHANGDAHPSMKVDKNANICKCHVCNLSGDPVEVAKKWYNGDFKKGCEWLHERFGVAFLDGSTVEAKPNPKPQQRKQTEYWSFDPTREYKKVVINDFLPKLSQMSEKQKLKVLYTFVYRFSLSTSQTFKENWYRSRGLESQFIKCIGFLSLKDIEKMVILLKKHFAVEDLQRFKLLNILGEWNYGHDVNVIPSFDLYSDMCEGLMLRYTDGRKTGKEVNISCQEIVFPLPFGLGRKALLKSKEIWINEGHVDGITLATHYFKKDESFAGFTGVWAWKRELFGLFRGKTVVVAFDKDKAGQEAQPKVIEELIKAGVPYRIAEWNAKDGKDPNELLKAGKLNTIVS